MTRSTFLSALLLACTTSVAQYAPPDPSGLQGIIIERYYVADANDAADTDGGTGLLAGATTYRVFVDLKNGYKLLTAGGFQDHPITMSTTTTFFNNDDRGDAWGYNINDIHLDKNTVAIDSWLTIGAGSDAHWAVLKNADTDGSVVGGANNDGGSTGTPLLVNDVPAMGIPLTTADGLWLSDPVPAVNAVGTAPDLFESGGASSYSNDNYAWAVLGGITAPDTNNRILIGQFTTDGVLSLCLNLFVKIPDSLVCGDPACHDFMIFYANLLPTDTAGESTANDNLFTHPSLCYTSNEQQVDCEGVMGGTALPGTPCNDGNDDTSNDAYAANCDCLGEDCLGTMGGSALPGTPCDDGNGATTNDIWQSGCICEGSTGIAEISTIGNIAVAPNPARETLRVDMSGVRCKNLRITLMNTLGAVQLTRDLGAVTGERVVVLDLSAVPQGSYFLNVDADGQRTTRSIVKL